MFIVDFINNLVLEAIKSKFGEFKQTQKYKERINDLLNREAILNLNVSREEEIDFQNLCDYILGEMMSDVSLRFWGNNGERAQARDDIARKSIYFAKANTSLSEARVKRIVYKSLDIANEIISNGISRDLMYVTNKLEDAIIDSKVQLTETIKAQNDELIAEIDKRNLLSSSQVGELSRNGDYKKIANSLGDVFSVMDRNHSLYPYFGFKPDSKYMFLSSPKSEEALLKYPERFQIVSDSVELGGKKIIGMNDEVLRESFNHQLPIKIHITDAKKYLGDVLDPIQFEAEDLIGKDVILKPPQFREAFPCAVYLNDAIQIPYLLLRTKEILDNGSVVLTNDEQRNYPYSVEIVMVLSENRVTFSINPRNPTSKEYLQFRSFVKEISLGKRIAIKSLHDDLVLVEANTDVRDTKEIDLEIALFEKVIRVEEYFNISLSVPDRITNGEEALLSRLFDLSCGEYRDSWKEFTFEFEVSDDLREKLRDSEDIVYDLLYSAIADFELWGVEWSCPIVRVIHGARHKDLSRLQEKIAVLDNGDKIKFLYVAEKGSYYIDKVKTGELEDDTVYACEGE